MPMTPDEFDPDDNFAQAFSTETDLDDDAALEAVAWQLLLLVNPGDEDAALQQFSAIRDAIADGRDPIDAIRDATDWKSGFHLPEDDVVGIVEALDELAARFDIRIDWGIDDVDDDALAGTDAAALLVRAGEQLREHHYTLWTWDTGMETHAGWITHQRDDEALPVVAGALGFHVRPAAL